MTSNLTQSVTKLIFGSAIAGFGFGIGRDAWRKLKSGDLVFWIIISTVVVLTLLGGFMGAREMVRGHDRGVLGTVFKTIILSVALVSLATICSLLFAVWLYGGENPILTSDQFFSFSPAMDLTIKFQLIAVSIGFLVGITQRKKRLAVFSIERDNEGFLKTAGIREVGGKEITHVDDDGNDLRLIEVLKDRLIFMAVGKRGRRAYIYLDDDGRMTSYSGITATPG